MTSLGSLICELHEKHGREFSGFAMKITGGRRDDAADLVQDVYTDLWARAEAGKSLPEELGLLRAYAYKAMVNRYTGDRRKARRHREILEGLPEIRAVAATATGQVEDRDLLKRSTACLSRQERTAIVLHVGYDMRLADVAAFMSAPVPTVQSWIKRGMTKLVKDLPRSKAHIPVVN